VPCEARTLPNLVDQASFHLVLNLEVEKAMRLRYCVSVVAVSIRPWTERVEEGRTPPLAMRFAEMAARRLRRIDLLTALAPNCIGLILIDADPLALPVIVGRAAEQWETASVAYEGSSWRIEWRAGAGSYPQTANTATALFRQATDLMVRAEAEPSQRVYLPALR
jgi:hypothetical protein